MFLIPFLTTWLCGWLAYRIVRGQQAQLDPLGTATSWLLGAGVIHFAHYLSMLVFRTEPPALLLVGVGLVGAIDLTLQWRRAQGDWSMFRRGGWWTAMLVVVTLTLLMLHALHGYGNDTVRIWLGRAEAYAALPDYWPHLDRYPYHPNYPPLVIHQYQWQAAFTDTMLGLKLPSMGFYLATLLVVLTLYEGRVRRPVAWIVGFAALPVYWVNLPYGMADTPVGAYVTAGAAWLYLAVRAGDRRAGWGAALLLGLATLVKVEGMALAGCVLAALGYLWLREPTRRTFLAQLFGQSVLLGGLLAVSWLALTWATGASGSDFQLAAFAPGHLPGIVQAALFVIFDPRTLQGVWLVFAAALLVAPTGRRLDVLIWLPPLLYASVMLLTYFFSVFGTGVESHVRFSYGRLLQQAMPLAMVYIAWALTRPVTTDVNAADAVRAAPGEL